MKISGVVCVGACGVCMCGVGECVEGGGDSIVAQFYLREIVFLEKLVCVCCMFLLMRYTVL